MASDTGPLMDTCACENIECGCVGHCGRAAANLVDVTNCPSYDVAQSAPYDAVPMCTECADYACLMCGAETVEDD